MKRYCDYDAIIHYNPGEFASQFADELDRKLELVERDNLESWEIESFLDKKFPSLRNTFVCFATAGNPVAKF